MAKIMDVADIGRVSRRIAHEIIERNEGPEDLVFLGIPTRGVPLAHRLAHYLADLEDAKVPVGSLDVGLYRDDLDTRPAVRLGPTDVPVAVDGKVVVLVDDVLFTGRTIRAALYALSDLGRPQRVALAVLIDQGHRELPIRPDFVGRNIPTAPEQRVSVRLEEIDDEEGIWVE